MSDKKGYRLPRWVSYPLLFVEIVVFVLMLSWLYFTRPVDTYTVPGMVGSELTEVEEILDEENIDYDVEWRSSLRTPEGEIIRQRPSPGREARLNRTLRLYVSRGAEEVRVPDLRGQSLMAAQSELAARGEAGDLEGPLVNIGNVARVYSNSVDEGSIIHQAPEPGALVLQGSQLDLLISRGPWPETTVVPSVTGRDIETARQLLKQQGLEVGRVRHVLDPEANPSVVLEQSPAPRIVTAPGEEVALTVNLDDPQPRAREERYSLFRFTPPRSLVPRKARVDLVDEQGTRTVFEDDVDPGQRIEFLTSYSGPTRLMFYWNGELQQIREVESPG